MENVESEGKPGKQVKSVKPAKPEEENGGSRGIRGNRVRNSHLAEVSDNQQSNVNSQITFSVLIDWSTTLFRVIYTSKIVWYMAAKASGVNL